ncbi:unnamed protein product [Spirodela intermedia]|uniref:Uncharacterized protein n=1 Tax=Spirodela intermedia TaxID=51605 RepID=A0A7I8K6K3_SPIIN|nr:unnamed protein product [Spirodela intermedia]
MGCRVVSGSYHPAERKNDDFAALWRLSPDGEELDGGGAREVATRLPVDRPLPDDNSRSFHRKLFSNFSNNAQRIVLTRFSSMI